MAAATADAGAVPASPRGESRSALAWVACLLATCLGLPHATADVVVLTSVADNTLYQDPNGALSNGAGSAMFAGTNSSSLLRRAVLRFDVAAALPADALVTDASLTLYNDAANAGAASLALHRLSQAWGEGASVAAGGQGSGAPSAPGDATWIHTNHPSPFWNTPGGDFDAGASAITAVTGPGFYIWSGLASDVQAFLTSPAADFGWIVLGDETTASSGKRFATRESASVAQRPALRIEYSIIPEPHIQVLWLLPMCVGVRRRPGAAAAQAKK